MAETIFSHPIESTAVFKIILLLTR